MYLRGYFLYHIKLNHTQMFARLEIQGKLNVSAAECWMCVFLKQAGILMYLLIIWDGVIFIKCKKSSDAAYWDVTIPLQ